MALPPKAIEMVLPLNNTEMVHHLNSTETVRLLSNIGTYLRPANTTEAPVTGTTVGPLHLYLEAMGIAPLLLRYTMEVGIQIMHPVGVEIGTTAEEKGAVEVRLVGEEAEEVGGELEEVRTVSI